MEIVISIELAMLIAAVVAWTVAILYINNNIQKAHLCQIKDLLNRPRRKKNITVGGLNRYIGYVIRKISKGEIIK